MLLRGKLCLLVLIWCLASPSESLLFPLLFPLSIKITIHSNSKPKPPVSSYHLEAVPVYREVSIKGSTHISSVPKYSYGDGTKYGTSYGDGHFKIYTEEPHTRKPKYHSGYDSGGSIEGQITISATPTTHYKGTPYEGVQFPKTHYKGSSGGTHYKGTAYEEAPQTHYKGTAYEETPQTHYKGTAYEETPQTHYKGTAYDDVPPKHYKGTAYDEVPQTHYKGSSYEDTTETHYKGSGYEDAPNDYNDPSYKSTVKNAYKGHSYIKPVGGYKLTDYIDPVKAAKYPDEPDYIVIPPGKTYAEIEAAHKASYTPKAYAAEEYADLGARKGKNYEHEPSHLDDTLPAYKSNIPRPRTRYRYQESASRHDRVLVPQPKKESKVYAGFGTSVYGDSYAKIVYVPRSLRIRIRAFAHK